MAIGGDVVVAAGMWCVAGGWSLRRIGDPVVAAASAGVRLRTRIGARAEEAEALTAMGELLGSVYRGELVGRIGLGRWDRRTHARWRAGGKQAVTAVSSSRWAGVITRAVEDQYPLGMRGVAARVAGLGVAVEVLAGRCVLRLGQPAPVAGTETGGRSRRRRGGYRSAAERLAKTRRLAVLRHRLGTAEDALTAGRASIRVGGKRLWRNRNHLDAADMDEQRWRDRWDGARMFLSADGESGKPGGNETIRVDGHGQLRIQVPSPSSGNWAAICRSARRCDSATAAANGGRGWRRGGRCVTTSARTPGRAAGIWMGPGKPGPHRCAHSRNGAPGGCWGWISTTATWAPVCSMGPGIRSVRRSASRWVPPG